jgi:hypothetical protein
MVKATLLRGGNYDMATEKVIWKNNVPAGEDTATYIAQQSLPASLYLPAKPVWWNSSPWPAIGPDVSGGNVAGSAGYAYNIPACDCYNNSPKGANGDVLFNADNCYKNVSSSRPALRAANTPVIPITVLSGKIKYQTLAPANVKLDVFDMAGKQVKTLVNGRVDAGIHTVLLDTKEFQAGAYFFALIAGDAKTTSKGIVLK